MASISELEKYYRAIRPADLLGKYSLKSFKGKELSSDSLFVQKLVETLIGVGSGQKKYGILKLSEIVESINEQISKAPSAQKSDVKNVIRVFSKTPLKESESYWKGDAGDTITWDTVVGSSQAGITPQLGVIQSASPFLSQNVRNVDKIVFFMNAIPTIELSRAVPFLDIQFQFSRAPTSDDKSKKLRVPSQLKFLDGAAELKSNTANHFINAASQDKQTAIDGTQKDVFRSGMELFTAPQTLLNPNQEDQTAIRFVPVIDKFRPFMSIDSFEVSVAPTTGLFCYKTAKLNLVLHDRSRLAEISDLVRPEVYSNTTLSISYGWSHPDDENSNNVYGALLNEMATYNEKYGIVNCSFSFDQVGQCKISLQLAMKGTQELRVVKIIESPEYVAELAQLDALQKQISDLRQASGFAKPEGFQREVRAYSILEVAERGELATILAEKDVQALIKKLKTQGGSTKEAANELADKLKEMFGTGAPKTGLAEKIKNTAESTINEKFKLLSEGEDPFLDKEDGSPVFKAINKIQPQNFKKGKTKAKKVCSLAKVLLTFMGIPLQSLKNVNEIQFMFYQFNSNAGQLGNSNIGSFPVEIDYLKKIFHEHVKKKANPNITINEFILLLQSSVINDPRAIGYGMRDEYQPRSDLSKEPELVKNSKIENTLASIMEKNGTFKFPVVEAYIETTSGRPFQEGQLASEKDFLDIMRVHIFDKAASPYEPMLQLLRSQTGLQEVVDKEAKKGNEKDSEATKKILVNSIALANEAGLNIKENGPGKFIVSGETNFQDMKDFITQVIPTIIYGTNFSAVANGTLATQQNQALSTVQMLRAAKQNNAEPNGSSTGGIPLRTIPAQLDLTIHGCPLLSINQQFFVDFKTGTTIDNIYLLTHLSHTIKSGKFETHAKFVPLDAYGVYESVVAKVKALSEALKEAAK